LSARVAQLVALVGCLSFGWGCQTVVTPPTDQDPSKEAWVAPWDKVARAHEAVAPKTISRVRTGEHLRLSTLRAGVGAPANLPSGACALIVIEGQGNATSPGRKELLEPGRILIVPDGREVTIGSNEVLRGMLIHAPKPGPSGPWKVMDVATIPIAEEAPGGDTELLRFEGALSMRSLTVFELGGIPRHVHLQHDSVFLFLSGDGTIGLGSEAATETTGPSVRDENLKRSFITTPVSAEVMVFLPAGSVHSFFAKGQARVLALQFFGPAFDGKDGHHIPSRAPAAGG
jgi:mannose-6-phosphate isomerase-like protein (cupin superfamily)